jgi:hypothetical protein
MIVGSSLMFAEASLQSTTAVPTLFREGSVDGSYLSTIAIRFEQSLRKEAADRF